ncbi:MAG TPA: ATP-binding cassette domain-containing protein, partial [Clostridia bacterium]|nr:ATP-binding cassette domain-containing protein [Clostridia bacterium]
LPISAKNGRGLDELLTQLEKYAAPGPKLFPDDMTTDQPDRQVCAEIVREKALELLSLFDMQDMASFQAGSLPYGAQRRLEMVRALATEPGILLLDEPAAGMNPSETAELMQNIKKVRDTFNIAVMLIEHDMSLVMGICEGIAVLNYGKIIAKGTPDEIKSNQAVIEAYLGRQEEGT